MRKVLKILPVILLFLALVAGCAKYAQPPPPNNVPAPVQPAKADPAKTTGATNASMSFLTNQLGWVVVNLERQQPPVSVILHTSDGGRNWVQLNSPGLSVIQQLAFPDAQHGWALVTADAGSNTHCAIVATTDGGQTWTQQWSEEIPQPGHPYQMQILDASNGFALIGDTFVATMDGGANWVKRPIAQEMSGFSFSAPASGQPPVGWAIGASSIWHTTDGGATWQRQWTMPDKIKSEFPDDGGVVALISPNTGWALLQGEGSMFKSAKLVLHTDDGSNWSITSSYLPPDIQAGLPPNQAPHDTATRFVPVSADTALLAASPPTDYPVLYRTVDNGSGWDTLSDGMSGVSGLPKGSWGDLSFVNASEGWAAVITQTPVQTGSSNTVSNVALLHTLDGGKTWGIQFPSTGH
jgi:photosystem II stability/assembly factor-like uncharacterized protein